MREPSKSGDLWPIIVVEDFLGSYFLKWTNFYKFMHYLKNA